MSQLTYFVIPKVNLKYALYLRIKALAREEASDHVERCRRPGLWHHVASAADCGEGEIIVVLCCIAANVGAVRARDRPRVPRRVNGKVHGPDKKNKYEGMMKYHVALDPPPPRAAREREHR